MRRHPAGAKSQVAVQSSLSTSILLETSQAVTGPSGVRVPYVLLKLTGLGQVSSKFYTLKK